LRTLSDQAAPQGLHNIPAPTFSGGMGATGRENRFSIAVEPVVRQDANIKNDCELNAAKRPVPQIRQAMQ